MRCSKMEFGAFAQEPPQGLQGYPRVLWRYLAVKWLPVEPFLANDTKIPDEIIRYNSECFIDPPFGYFCSEECQRGRVVFFVAHDESR